MSTNWTQADYAGSRWNGRTSNGLWPKQEKRQFKAKPKAKLGGAPFAYSCVGCHQEFFDGIRKSQSCCGAEECQVVRRRMSSQESIARRAAGPFPYTCIGCNQSFADGLRRNQSCCGAEECIKARDHQFALERAETARETREVRETKVRDEVADQIARIWETKRERSLPDGVVISESWADQCEAYYTAGLTPLQVKSRAIKNAARLAEIKAGLARFGGKKC